MEQVFNQKMSTLGYDKLVCDIFGDWEDVKDEILLPERKEGSGNGTIHVFLGAADNELRKEFGRYYQSVENGESTAVGAVEIKHYFLPSNIISMLGYVCEYYYRKKEDYRPYIQNILSCLAVAPINQGMLETTSLFKLSVGSDKLRPYFKRFESNGVFSKLVRQVLLPKSSYKIGLYKNRNNEYAAFWLIGFSWQSDFEANSSSDSFIEDNHLPVAENDFPRQVIYYGAPGTGKSHTIKEETKGKHVIRTTFHPDSDYSTFVGAYKPITTQVPRYISLGDKAIELKDSMGKPIMESRIEYEFVEQAFLQAYVNAWKLYATSSDGKNAEPQYLVIEEINRGNCAQIFGDLFQLLDRKDNGFSEYPITADTDMQNHLAKVFKDIEIPNADVIDSMYDGGSITEKIKKGEVLLFPGNLYIWATMNTSDQSLFPIDSAFKRRWEWKYVPISKGVDKETNTELNWRIQVNGSYYDWWSFLEKINEQIGNLTSSQDKKLGFFFCKARNGIITAERFVDKVLFFIWNEVLKDYEKEQDFLEDGGSGNYLTFDQFYGVDANGKTVINEEKAEVLLSNLGLKRIQVGENVPADTDE